MEELGHANEIKKLAELIRGAGRIAFFGGAGVSTESGIPDFRSQNGIYDAIRKFGERPEVLLSRSYFFAHTEKFYEYYRSALLLTDVQPNDAHHALASLEKQGRLTAVITQNIDGLHQKAGSKNVYELHGSIFRNHCLACGRAYTAQELLSMQAVPRCACGGLVKPDVVLYEEGLDHDTIQGAVQHILRADMLIVGGTSLAVYPAAGLVDYYRGNKLVLINKSVTPQDPAADLVIHAPIGQVLRQAKTLIK